MKNGPRDDSAHGDDFPAPPLTLEGFSLLHQMFRVRKAEWRARTRARREAAVAEAATLFDQMERREDGHSALFQMLGHKGDLLAIHCRRGFNQLAEVQHQVDRLELSEFLEPATSYLSMVEIGLYEATVKLHADLREQGIKPYSPEWDAAQRAELDHQREKLGKRLWPSIPARRYVCFYPMNKRRSGSDNWYMRSIDDRQSMMRDHGMIGRRYAGQVTQIISGSIGFDDWEWGVDLFADDPLVFKKLVYEMRFDESSARYAEFGPFFVGLRLAPAALKNLLLDSPTA